MELGPFTISNLLPANPLPSSPVLSLKMPHLVLPTPPSLSTPTESSSLSVLPIQKFESSKLSLATVLRLSMDTRVNLELPKSSVSPSRRTVTLSPQLPKDRTKSRFGIYESCQTLPTSNSNKTFKSTHSNSITRHKRWQLSERTRGFTKTRVGSY